MIDRTSVMSAVLGASTAVAGLLLVFQGFVVSTYASFPSGTDARTLTKYKRTVAAVVAFVGISILVAAGAMGWLLGVNVFWVTVAGFFMILALLFAAAVMVTALILE
ncbi:MAG: hypothetical protein ACYDAK_13430 [Candidatus Limnocylindrales bacterium]